MGVTLDPAVCESDDEFALLQPLNAEVDKVRDEDDGASLEELAVETMLYEMRDRVAARKRVRLQVHSHWNRTHLSTALSTSSRRTIFDRE